jgi:hypothetical protein
MKKYDGTITTIDAYSEEMLQQMTYRGNTICFNSQGYKL